MSGFERYLSLWVALCIAVGIALGHRFPNAVQAIGAAEVAHVNLPVAVLIWLMIIPMLTKIDFGALHQVKEHWRGIGVTVFVNWAVKPFSMALLGWLFVGLLLGLSAITVPWQTLVLSVVLYIVVPVIIAQGIRRALLKGGGLLALNRVLSRLQPFSLVALLATLVLLFAFQGEQILAQPLVIALLAVPILIQVYFNTGLAYLLNRAAGEVHSVAAPSWVFWWRSLSCCPWSGS